MPMLFEVWNVLLASPILAFVEPLGLANLYLVWPE
jgi:hypothetical protein